MRARRLLCSAILAAGCAPVDAGPAPIVIRDSLGIRIVENDLTRLTETCAVSAQPRVTIGVAEGEEAYELYRVFGAARLSDGRIVLVNQGTQQIRFYDREGRFLSAAGRAGEGPGEFRNAFHLWILPGDTVAVGNYRPWEFLLFSPEGNWLRTVRPTPFYPNPPGVAGLLRDGRAVLSQDGRGRQTDSRFQDQELTVVVHGADGGLHDTLGIFPHGRRGQVDPDPASVWLFPLFESFTRVAAGGSRVVLGHGATSELAVHDMEGGPQHEMYVRWTVGDRTIGAEDIDAERRRLIEPYADMEPGRRRRLVDPLVSEARPVADRFPAFSAVRLGRDGRIWVREYPRPGDTERQRWIVFASDGRFQCRATLPKIEELLEAGADYVLGEGRGELDVERVLEYSLAPPGAPPVR